MKKVKRVLFYKFNINEIFQTQVVKIVLPLLADGILTIDWVPKLYLPYKIPNNYQSQALYEGHINIIIKFFRMRDYD